MHLGRDADGWIPFHDCPGQMGPLMVVDGSHRWAELEHDELRGFRNTDFDKMEERLFKDHANAGKFHWP